MALIKCPVCGQKVSSLSITCPNCSTRIKGNIQQCPNCEEWVLVGKGECEACGSAIENSVNDEEQSTTHENREQQEQTEHFKTKEPKQPKKKNGCIITLVCMLIIASCLAAAAYAFHRYNEKEKAEKEAIRQELLKRIAEDKKANEERFLLMQQDSSYWEKTLKAKTIEAAEAYISAYPEGIFINEAYMLLEELNRRKVSPSEEVLIRNVVEKKLEEYRKKSLRKKEADVLGIHPQIANKLKITKKYINRDSFQYVVRGDIAVTINRTNPKKPNKQDIKLEIIMDSKKKVLESNL